MLLYYLYSSPMAHALLAVALALPNHRISIRVSITCHRIRCTSAEFARCELCELMEGASMHSAAVMPFTQRDRNRQRIGTNRLQNASSTDFLLRRECAVSSWILASYQTARDGSAILSNSVRACAPPFALCRRASMPSSWHVLDDRSRTAVVYPHGVP